MKFPGLKELIESAPKEGAICGWTTNAFVARWDEKEQRYIEVHDVPQEHFIKYPGEPWRRL